MTTVCLLHPGDMGAAVGANIVANGHTVLWVSTDRSEFTVRRAAEAGLTPAVSLADALSRAEVVLSICPPAVAREVADQVSEIGYAGLYVEANAISPEKYARISFLSGLDRVIDGAIIGPPPRGVEARLYLAGPPELTAVVAGLFEVARVTVRDVGSDLGAASALKMAYASFQKAARLLAAVAHALARKYGVGEFLAAEAVTMPGGLLHGQVTQVGAERRRCDGGALLIGTAAGGSVLRVRMRDARIGDDPAGCAFHWCRGTRNRNRTRVGVTCSATARRQTRRERHVSDLRGTERVEAAVDRASVSGGRWSLVRVC